MSADFGAPKSIFVVVQLICRQSENRLWCSKIWGQVISLIDTTVSDDAKFVSALSVIIIPGPRAESAALRGVCLGGCGLSRPSPRPRPGARSWGPSPAGGNGIKISVPGSHVLLKIVGESIFWKTYFYTLASISPMPGLMRGRTV